MDVRDDVRLKVSIEGTLMSPKVRVVVEGEPTITYGGIHLRCKPVDVDGLDHISGQYRALGGKYQARITNRKLGLEIRDHIVQRRSLDHVCQFTRELEAKVNDELDEFRQRIQVNTLLNFNYPDGCSV